MVAQRYRSWCAAILVAIASIASAQLDPLLNQTYDYIIVGGGMSGLTVANRLSENGKRSVLVIEYGDLADADDQGILLPAETFKLHPEKMYNITALPVPGLNNRISEARAGAVVGGGSAVNGMFFDRGSAADYDAWEALGNPGWGWSSLLPYFKKSVTFTPPTPDIAEKYNYTWDVESAYGENGPIQLSYPPFGWPGISAVWEAWKQWGISKQKEGANGNAYGVFFSPNSLDPVTRTRSYARTAHYDPFRNRTNLHLLTGYQVTEVRLVNTDVRVTAVGVNVVKRGTTQKFQVQAKRETILAAGALWTPWLLQRSGLGPRSVLEKAGIQVRRDMPGVGANFQDHPFGGPSWKFTNDVFPNPAQLDNATFYEEARKEYEANRTGPLTLSRGNEAGFLPLSDVDPNYQSVLDSLLAQNPSAYLPETYDANLTAGYAAQLNLTASLFERNDFAAFEFPFRAGPLGAAALTHPLSRGTVNINTTDPSNVPVIDYRTLSNPVDLQLAIAALRFIRKFNGAEALKGFKPVEVAPGLNVTSDSDIERALRESLLVASLAHPCGTASMLPEEFGGVVGPDLKVWQIRRLSVVDASVIPFIPAAHLSTTVYAVAEKAADLIKARE